MADEQNTVSDLADLKNLSAGGEGAAAPEAQAEAPAVQPAAERAAAQPLRILRR